MFRQPAVTLLAILVLLSGVAVAGETLEPVSFQSHDITLSLDIPNHVALIQDSGLMRIGQGWNLLFINEGADIQRLTIAGNANPFLTVMPKDTAVLPADLQGQLPKFEQWEQAKTVLFKLTDSGLVKFAITFRTHLNQDVENVQFSREKVGNEITGTILEQGAYLSPSAYYYPQGKEMLAHYRLTADIPDTWESIADGNSVRSEVVAARKLQVWENPFAADGCTFMAAPYVVKTIPAGEAEVAAYFFEADTGLAQSYLAASAKYIAMYSELIGPYPFKRFTVAENFFPTGYGMPGWTLLGQTVLRLPFIISTSLGHEVLHNWWGNSVYVDYSRGNWCEAATTYGADYRYKLIESEAAARDYRKDILKDYVNYVSKDKDFPIREFKSRTSANTRTIGYNKAMMVFHLIEQEIGTQAFFDAWKYIYKTYRGEQISWEEWIKAFEQASGKDLSYIIPQWIDRPGAPVLGLELHPEAGNTVMLRLTQQKDTLYTLNVPIRVEGSEARDTMVSISAAATDATVGIPAGAATVAVDPDYHIFRRLYPEEVEPVISAVMGSDKKVFDARASDASENEVFQAFACNLVGDTARQAFTGYAQADRASALVLINPGSLPDVMQDLIYMSNDSVVIQGRGFSRAGHTFVYSGQNWQGFGKYLVVLSFDLANLPRIGQLIPHYGKYSYLVFEGARNVAKGNWEVTESPLKLRLPR